MWPKPSKVDAFPTTLDVEPHFHVQPDRPALTIVAQMGRVVLVEHREKMHVLILRDTHGARTHMKNRVKNQPRTRL